MMRTLITMNKILYYMGLISEVLFLLMVLFLLPYILRSSWKGIFFLIMVLIFIGISLFIFLSRRNFAKESKAYNIFTIALTFYLGIIFTRIMLVKLSSSILYAISITYCENNFFLLAITMLCVTLNTTVLVMMKHEK